MYAQICILLLMFISAQGIPDNAAIEKETNKWGTEISFCTFKGIKFLPGSSWTTTDCESCSCFDDGLFCEGFGYAAGAVDAPEGCKVVNDGCQPRVVKTDNELKDCPLPE